MDGRGVSVKMQLGLDTEDSSRNSSGCVIDREAMKYNPVRVKFSHFDKSTALRKLLAWAAEEFGTNVGPGWRMAEGLSTIAFVFCRSTRGSAPSGTRR